MILGSGVDLIEVSRFEREVARRGPGLIAELFSAGELAWCRRHRRPAEGHAVVYAAKEALFKALGTGKVGRMAWHDIAVAWPAGASQPTVALAGESAAVAAAMGVSAVHLATALTKTLAAAWVVVTGLGTRDSGVVRHAEAKAPSSTAKPPEPRIPDPESRQSQENR